MAVLAAYESSEPKVDLARYLAGRVFRGEDASVVVPDAALSGPLPSRACDRACRCKCYLVSSADAPPSPRWKVAPAGIWQQCARCIDRGTSASRLLLAQPSRGSARRSALRRH